MESSGDVASQLLDPLVESASVRRIPSLCEWGLIHCAFDFKFLWLESTSIETSTEYEILWRCSQSVAILVRWRKLLSDFLYFLRMGANAQYNTIQWLE
jgi:hypothetical protein